MKSAIVSWRRLAGACALAAAVIFVPLAGSARAQEAVATSGAAGKGATAVDAKAEAVLKKVAAYYKGLKSASFEINTTVKMEAQGRKQEMTARQEAAVERPNKLAVVTTEGQAGGGTIVSDGKTLVISVPTLHKYAEAKAPATLGELLGDRMVIGLAGYTGAVLSLFSDDPYAKLMEGATALSYVGQEDVDGAKVDRVRLTQDWGDMDLLVDAGDKPLVRRLVPDMTKTLKRQAERAPEQMQGMKVDIRAELANWKTNDPVPAERFTFAPPAGAQKVDSIAAIFGREESKLKGQPAPAFSVDLVDGKKMDLKQHQGKDVVILDFWATWCGPCVQALPIVTEVAKAYAGKGVVFYAVNEQEEPAKIQEFLKQHNLDIQVALDKDGHVGQLYGVTGIPQTVIIGKDGRVAEVHVGYDPEMKTSLSKDLDKALAAGESKSAETK